ncbi:Protein of unknown function [Agrococcus baldri]|uniref:DUF2695 domain-containing protein n=1 Tax=Agrococcus baldri TaxID=153730 RepID=A0AA94HKB3_9MICO|nr:DUF2695 domain-containing protein [Agrococcus baldri]SFR99623.1 Protein of unknown function [Agrococcus baldri]
MDEPITAEAESYVRELAELWLAPHEQECLSCYLDRVVAVFGCQGDLRFAGRYRDLAAPRATALERRLSDSGGRCDCEVLMNTMQPAWHLWKPRRTEVVDGWATELDAEPPDEMPHCTGVRRGSTQPCRNWHSMLRPSSRGRRGGSR